MELGAAFDKVEVAKKNKTEGEMRLENIGLKEKFALLLRKMVWTFKSENLLK